MRDSEIFQRIGKNGVGWERPSRMSLGFVFSEFLKKFREEMGLMRACELFGYGVIERTERAQLARLVLSAEG